MTQQLDLYTFVSRKFARSGWNLHIPFLELCDGATNVVYHTTELMTEDVALLHFYNRAVEQMQIGAANSGSGNLEDNIAGLDDRRLGRIDYANIVLAEPCQSLHGLGVIRPLFLVAGVCDILRSNVVVIVADGLLDFHGCLGQHLGRLWRGGLQMERC